MKFNFGIKPAGGFFILLVFVGGVGFLGHRVTSRFTEPFQYVSGLVVESEIPPPPKHISTPDAVKGIYMTSWVAGTPSIREDVVRFIESSEVNAVVIDVKDYTGKVAFKTNDQRLATVEYSENRIPDVKEFIDDLHRKNIYVIGRISVFQDPHLVKKRPDLAVKKKNGEVWKDKKGITWLDPAGEESWDFMARIGKEAEKVGFDELNFDYIRFPSDGNMQDIAYPFWDGETLKAEVIKKFFAYLETELADTGVPISADIFGLTTWYTYDLNIGQVLEYAIEHFDYVSPMVYPSHYPPTFQGYQNPAEHPYEIVKTAMERGRERVVAMGENPNKLRPWLQDFDLGAVYDASMVRLQMQAVYDAGLNGWLMWDPSNKYTREAYDPVSEE